MTIKYMKNDMCTIMSKFILYVLILLEKANESNESYDSFFRSIKV